MAEGWFKVYRELMEKPIWLESSAEQKVILITLLSMANHKGREWEWKGKPYRAEAGQFVTSLESICKGCGKGVSIQNARTALKRFEKYKFLTNESTKQNRLITIVNWGIYQGNEESTNKETNRRLTDSQQTPNNQLTTNKNVKNVKNDKNERNKKNRLPEKKVLRKKYGEYKNVLLSDKELETLKQEFSTDWEDRIERVSEYCASQGKSYKNYLATIRNWAKRDKKPQQVGYKQQSIRQEILPDWVNNPPEEKKL
ncbi:hypothetical protein, partial [Melissococcus plutonius]